MKTNWAKLEHQYLTPPEEGDFEECSRCQKEAEVWRGICKECYDDMKDAAAEHAFECARDERGERE